MKTVAKILRDNRRWQEDHNTTWLEYMQVLHQEIHTPADLDISEYDIEAMTVAALDEYHGRVS